MSLTPSLDAVRSAAAAWVVRLQDGGASDEDLLEFDRWLDLSPVNRAAYDEALETWLQFDARAELANAFPPTHARRPRPVAQRWGLAGTAVGAAALAASALIAVGPLGDLPAKFVEYSTTRGEHRTITLADGSRIELNALTRLSVRLGRRERRVELLGGEAAFFVAHDPTRPFVVRTIAGDIRDLGTEFDVRQRTGSLSLTVSHGEVEFTPTRRDETRRVRLTPGQRLDCGTEGTIRVHTVAPEDDFSWRTGRLVLRDQPLGALVAELNLYFARPIRIESPELATRLVSGVLQVDTQEATLRRLRLFTPLEVEVRGQEIVLRRAGAAKPAA